MGESLAKQITTSLGWRVRWFVPILLAMTPTSSYAYSFLLGATQLEYMASSPMCREAIITWNTNRGYPLQFIPRKHKDYRPPLAITETGGWHYCGGAIKIRRGEASTNPAERVRYLEEAVIDINYTGNRIDKREPWGVHFAGYRNKS
jgi:hypothetical protein